MSLMRITTGVKSSGTKATKLRGVSMETLPMRVLRISNSSTKRCVCRLFLHFLSTRSLLILSQAQKFGSFADDDDDDELDEESLLETPLDKVEPYGLFKHVLLSKFVCLSTLKRNKTSNYSYRPSAGTTTTIRDSYEDSESGGTANHPGSHSRSGCQGPGCRKCGGCWRSSGQWRQPIREKAFLVRNINQRGEVVA